MKDIGTIHNYLQIGGADLVNYATGFYCRINHISNFRFKGKGNLVLLGDLYGLTH